MNRGNMRLLLCGILVLGVAAPAAAQTPPDLPLKMRGKDWCQSSPSSVFPDGKSKNFNLRHAYRITMTADANGSGNITGRINKEASSNADASLTEFDLHGQGLFRNKSNHKVEFVLNGVHPTVPGLFITLRGQASIDRATGAIKKANGMFVYERDDNQNSDPAVHCFGRGTFETEKDEDHHHSDDHGAS